MVRRRRTDVHLKDQRERKYRLRGGKARTTRFIPDSDSEFARMARTFALHVERHRERLNISSEQSEELSRAVAAFRDALCKTKIRASAGPNATAAKNYARKDAEKIVRTVGRHLRGLDEKIADGC